MNVLASYLAHTSSFNESYFSYIHTTQGFVWFFDYPVFFYGLFGLLSGTETAWSFVPISPWLWAPREVAWDRGFWSDRSLDLVKWLGTQNHIKTWLLTMYIILISTTSSCSNLSSRYYKKTKLHYSKFSLKHRPLYHLIY